MEILVCIKRVPDISGNEIELSNTGSDIKRDDLVYWINESDNYALEEAIQIAERVGGNVTVVTVGKHEDEEVLRRALAMGANKCVLISDDSFAGSDGKGIATILKSFAQKNAYDLILTGVQAEAGNAQVGGMLGALLDYPFASLISSIEVKDGSGLKIGRDIEGGIKEMNEIELPCVLSIQTGINEPRYVGLRGLKKVESVQIPVLRATDLGIDPGTVGVAAVKVKKTGYFMPSSGQGAEMLEGTTEEMINRLIEQLKEKGVVI